MRGELWNHPSMLPTLARLVLPALALAVVPVGAAHAQSAEAEGDANDDAMIEQDQNDAEAHVLFNHGRVAMAEGRFEEALQFFERSYALSGRPELLYNIGMVHDRLRHDEEAISSFRRFLQEAPDVQNRAEVERRIAVLQDAVQSGDAEGEGEEEGIDLGGLILSSAGGAVLVAGVVMVAIAAADVSSVENAADGSSWSSVSGAYDRSQPLSIAGIAAIAAGAIAAGIGVVLLLTRGRGSETAVSIGPGGVSLRGRF